VKNTAEWSNLRMRICVTFKIDTHQSQIHVWQSVAFQIGIHQFHLRQNYLSFYGRYNIAFAQSGFIFIYIYLAASPGGYLFARTANKYAQRGIYHWCAKFVFAKGEFNQAAASLCK